MQKLATGAKKPCTGTLQVVLWDDPGPQQLLHSSLWVTALTVTAAIDGDAAELAVQCGQLLAGTQPLQHHTDEQNEPILRAQNDSILNEK